MNRNIVHLGRYEGWHRELAKGVASGDRECMSVAAKLFDLYIPDRAVVVPMPSHHGTAEQMAEVARMMAHDSMDILECVPHMSNREQKEMRFVPNRISMSVVKSGWEPYARTKRRIFVIDNVICSGVTADAALEAFSRCGVEATVIALARSLWR